MSATRSRADLLAGTHLLAGASLLAGAHCLLVAAAVIGGATVCRVVLAVLVGSDPAAVVHATGVAVAVLLGGPCAGLFAALLGALAGAATTVPTPGLLPWPASVPAETLAYLICALVLVVVVHRLMRARDTAATKAAAAARLASIVHHTGDAIVGLDRKGTIVTWNPAAEQMFGHPAEEIVGRPASVLFPLALPEGDASPAALLSSESVHFTTRWVAKDGHTLDVSVTTGPMDDPDGGRAGIAAIVRDVSRQVAAEAALRDAHRRNVMLLGEIHHRMKNNLQMVAGLIWACSRRTDQAAARKLLIDLQQRVGAIARIHDHLYETDDFTRVDLCNLLHRIIGDLAGLSSRDAEISLATDGPQVLTTETAVPIVLAVNELVTNALRHAGVDRPSVHVRCIRDEAALVVTVTDTGHGLPPDFEIAKARGFGMRMASGAVGQVGGTLRALPTLSGAAFEIRVPRPALPIDRDEAAAE
ncbi:sensor histidine kinase [Rhodovulum sp. PH10]|uniref:sensor histidine kinase n=1 Tax=Rhodovulum sp. PH10 TaxID=1187851 RepID=UPI00178C4BDA|nr:PAS domain S-box protein [Rhodovulum sp. PH10]